MEHYTQNELNAAVKAERDRCLRFCRIVMDHHDKKAQQAGNDDDRKFRRAEECGAEDCIEAITNEGKWP